MCFTKQYVLQLISFCVLFFCVACGEVHYYDFVVKEANFTRLCSTKSLLVVNDSFPGPTLHVRKGDTAYVNVHNQGNYGITIHWHGVLQPGNSWFDGPEYVTQCPIEPGTNFTYQVLFTTEEGSLWWHAHSDWTRAGVHGAIVISPADGTDYPYPTPDGEEILVIGSWYKGEVNQIVSENLISGADLPISDSYVINGQPGDFCNCSKEGTYRWMVEPNRTYLVHLINAAMNAEHFFTISGHNFTVVGTDGTYLKPIETDYLVIGAGQTMDILLTTNQPQGQYYIAIRQFYTVKLIYNYDKTNVTAILQYTGSDIEVPGGTPTFPTSLPVYADFRAAAEFESQKRSLASEVHPVDIPMNISTSMFVVIGLGQIVCPKHDCGGLNGNKLTSSMNNISFINPSTDVLLAYYKNISEIYSLDFPNKPPSYFDFTNDATPNSSNVSIPLNATKVKVLDYNEEVEIIFQGSNVLDVTEIHPMHLHGHTFYVVGSGHGNFDPELHPKTYNLIDPPEQSTVSVPKAGWATVRFRARNPGVWLWHCHFDRHLSWGMDSVFIVKNGGTPETSLRPPPEYLPPCKVPHKKSFHAF